MPPLGVGFLLRGHFPQRARRALFAGKRVVQGNLVSSEYEKKSRRAWKPNVVYKRLFSEALGRDVQLRLTTTALRHIDAAGGLDSYLMRTPDRLLMSDVASDLKFRIGLVHKQRWHELGQQKQHRLQHTSQRLPQHHRSNFPSAVNMQSAGNSGRPSQASESMAGLDALRRQQAETLLQYHRPAASPDSAPAT